ncbi:MAG: hypothetical protein KJO57_18200, partial [Deltaproteobacteria bacterium]|nr:hypothetical protein [Deltaproteobacteria bacterium]
MSPIVSENRHKRSTIGAMGLAKANAFSAPRDMTLVPRNSHLNMSPMGPAANKPKALSTARGDLDIFDVLQSHILP